MVRTITRTTVDFEDWAGTEDEPELPNYDATLHHGDGHFDLRVEIEATTADELYAQLGKLTDAVKAHLEAS